MLPTARACRGAVPWTRARARARSVVSIEDLLAAFGCGVVGPLGRLAAAQRAAQSRDFDCAILDVNINGDPVFPVAEILSERGIPFIFVTGHGESGAGERFTGRPVLRKPFRPDELRAALAMLVAR